MILSFLSCTMRMIPLKGPPAQSRPHPPRPPSQASATPRWIRKLRLLLITAWCSEQQLQQVQTPGKSYYFSLIKAFKIHSLVPFCLIFKKYFFLLQIKVITAWFMAYSALKNTFIYLFKYFTILLFFYRFFLKSNTCLVSLKHI